MKDRNITEKNAHFNPTLQKYMEPINKLPVNYNKCGFATNVYVYISNFSNCKSNVF